MSELDKFIRHGPRCLAGLYSTIGRCSCGAQDAIDELADLRKALLFHPRAAKLMLKQKNFVAVAIDEPYFADVYGMIRESEKQKGSWTGEDEQLWRDALYRVGVDPDRVQGIRDVVGALLEYRRANTINFQLEKLDDFLRELRELMEKQP
jgi:hypothetical protein